MELGLDGRVSAVRMRLFSCPVMVRHLHNTWTQEIFPKNCRHVKLLSKGVRALPLVSGDSPSLNCLERCGPE
jgi:hypothetical protein